LPFKGVKFNVLAEQLFSDVFKKYNLDKTKLNRFQLEDLSFEILREMGNNIGLLRIFSVGFTQFDNFSSVEQDYLGYVLGIDNFVFESNSSFIYLLKQRKEFCDENGEISLYKLSRNVRNMVFNLMQEKYDLFN
jgi:hypothetical protein